MRVKLYAPPEYWLLSQEEKRRICNGCGPKGGKLNFLLPGGRFKAACDIHDYMYAIGKDEEDKRRADRVFVNNLYRIVETYPKIWRPIAKLKAKGFYAAVRDFGEDAFWRGKVVEGMVGKEVEV